MIKKFTAAILAFALLLIMVPVQASAAGAEGDELKLEASAGTLLVKLILPNAKGEKLSSLQLRLELNAGAFSEFQFDQAVTGKAKTYEAYYDADNKNINLYIAGTEPLFTSDTLTIGSVGVKSAGNTPVEASGGEVMVVRGTQMADLELSDSVDITFDSNASGSTGGGYYPGGYYPGSNPGGYYPGSNPQQPSADPEKPTQPDPQQPAVTPEEPQTPEEPAAMIAQPDLAKVQNTAAGVTVKWKKSSNAAGYYVYRKTQGGKWKRIANVKGKNKVSYTDKAVKSKNGKMYIYTVKAYNGSNVSKYSKTGLTIYRLTCPALLKPVSKAAGSMLVTWKQNKKAAGYQIQYARSADFQTQKLTKTVKSVKKTSQTITKLKKRKTYYVRIRSYQKVNGVTYYSAWSAVKKVKTK